MRLEWFIWRVNFMENFRFLEILWKSWNSTFWNFSPQVSRKMWKNVRKLINTTENVFFFKFLDFTFKRTKSLNDNWYVATWKILEILLMHQFIWILKIQNKVNFIPSKLGIGTNLCVIKPHFNSVKPSYNIFVQNTVF